jgi:hypothetical protein
MDRRGTTDDDETGDPCSLEQPRRSLHRPPIVRASTDPAAVTVVNEDPFSPVRRRTAAGGGAGHDEALPEDRLHTGPLFSGDRLFCRRRQVRCDERFPRTGLCRGGLEAEPQQQIGEGNGFIGHLT